MKTILVVLVKHVRTSIQVNYSKIFKICKIQFHIFRIPDKVLYGVIRRSK